MSKKDIFKDLSRFASSTFEAMSNMKNDIAHMINEQIKTSLKKMDFVTKAEFNALKKSVEELRKSAGTNKKPDKSKKTKKK